MSGEAKFVFAPAAPADLERLTALRVEAMRESLTRIGHFDPDRARRRMLEQYRPQYTRLIHAGRRFAGCVAFAPVSSGLRVIEHFYIDPAMQGRGLGAAVLSALLAEADTAREVVELTVVRESPALRLYARHGFVETGRDNVDVFLRRDAPTLPPG